MSRFSAFGAHIGISLIIFVALAYLVVFEWYPGMFFNTDGGWRGMRIIFAVDLVLGPLLTLIVFKSGKPGLKFDLAVIGVLQICCLAAGTYIVFDERPLTVVYNDGRFTVMAADEYRRDAGIDVPDLHLFPGDDPKWVMVNIPTDLEAESDLRTSTYKSGRLISSLTELYIPFSKDAPAFLNDAVDTTVLTDQERWVVALDKWFAEHGGTIEDYRFYTFSTRYEFGYLAFDKATNKQIGLMLSDPIPKAKADLANGNSANKDQADPA